jgi:SecD/SecF fusion protein
MVKDIGMLQLFSVPNVDWYGKRRLFATLSIGLIGVGLFALYSRGKDAFDVEFRGGSSVEIELKPGIKTQYDDVAIGKLLAKVGGEIATDGGKLAAATVTGSGATMRLSAGDLTGARLGAMIAERLESANLIERGGVDATSQADAVIITPAEGATPERLQAFVRALADPKTGIPQDGDELTHASVGMIIETDEAEQKGRLWNLTTTVTNTQLVQYALLEAFGDDLKRQPRVTYSNAQPYPITERRLEAVVPNLPTTATADLVDYIGGVALHFRNLNPPQPLDEIRERLKSMRLQPDYADLPWRRFDVISAGETGNGLSDQVVIVVIDEAMRYNPTSPDLWNSALAQPELAVAKATLDTEQSLRRVTQFKPQIAAQSQQQAIIALVLSWAMIIAYLWIRFGRPMYGVAGVVALIHDVCIALAFIGFAGWIGGNAIGHLLFVESFKIDMTVIAALLTIIGYSINDTIVVFDRIREVRGRLGVVAPDVINRSINQTLSRTIMTSVTTLVVLTTLYVFGGNSIRGFNYCMIIGVLTGTYSSIAIAAPLLMMGFRRTGHAGAGRAVAA